MPDIICLDEKSLVEIFSETSILHEGRGGGETNDVRKNAFVTKFE